MGSYLQIGKKTNILVKMGKVIKMANNKTMKKACSHVMPKKGKSNKKKKSGIKIEGSAKGT